MTLTEQVFAQAALLAGELDGRQTNLLRLLCGASASSLTARLREGLTPEDCKADFIAAASLLALAQLDADKYRKCLTEYQRLLREAGKQESGRGFPVLAASGRADDRALSERRFFLPGGLTCGEWLRKSLLSTVRICGLPAALRRKPSGLFSGR